MRTEPQVSATPPGGFSVLMMGLWDNGESGLKATCRQVASVLGGLGDSQAGVGTQSPVTT